MLQPTNVMFLHGDQDMEDILGGASWNLPGLANNYGKSPFFMGKSTMSMAIFNSYVCLPEGKFFAAHIYSSGIPCTDISEL